MRLKEIIDKATEYNFTNKEIGRLAAEYSIGEDEFVKQKPVPYMSNDLISEWLIAKHDYAYSKSLRKMYGIIDSWHNSEAGRKQ